MQNYVFSGAGDAKSTICPLLTLVVLVRTQTLKTLKILVIFQMMKKTSFIMDQNKNSSDYRRKSTSPLLHAKTRNPLRNFY